MDSRSGTARRRYAEILSGINRFNDATVSVMLLEGCYISAATFNAFEIFGASAALLACSDRVREAKLACIECCDNGVKYLSMCMDVHVHDCSCAEAGTNRVRRRGPLQKAADTLPLPYDFNVPWRVKCTQFQLVLDLKFSFGQASQGQSGRDCAETLAVAGS